VFTLISKSPFTYLVSQIFSEFVRDEDPE